MSGESESAEARPAGGMNNEQLIALYDQRWNQIHHLNDLDQRSIVLVVTAITGSIVASPSGFNLAPDLGLALGVLAIVICIGGIYSTIRNRVSMEYPLSSIDFIESILNEREVGLFPYAGNYVAPTSLSHFSRRMLFSIRGPIILFFTVALVAIIWSITARTISMFISSLQLSALLSGTIAVISVSLFVWWCLRDNWNRGKLNFEILNRNHAPARTG